MIFVLVMQFSSFRDDHQQQSNKSTPCSNMVNPNQKELVLPEDFDCADELEKNKEKAGKVPVEIILNDYTKNNAGGR
jgi:hypothetical protein